MRVTVTGAEGFIGLAVVRLLQEMGHEVIWFDKTLGHDIRSMDEVLTALKNADAVIHLAGLLGTHELFWNSAEAVDVNVSGTVNVLRACEMLDVHMIGIEQPRIWKNPYSITRAAARDMATAWHESFGVPVTYVRAFNAHGPGQKHGRGHPQKIIPTFAVCAWLNRPLPVWGDGSQVVDLIDVEDVAAIFMDALEFPGEDETIDAGTGIPVTVKQVAERIIEHTGSSSEIEYLPMRLGENPDVVLPVATGESWDRLNWKPEFRWDDVFYTVDWYRSWRP